MLPAGTARVRLVPAHARPVGDRRRLGAAIKRISLGGVVVDSQTFAGGLHMVEADWRWTDGDATLRIDPHDAPRAIEISIVVLAGLQALAAWNIKPWRDLSGQPCSIAHTVPAGRAFLRFRTFGDLEIPVRDRKGRALGLASLPRRV